MEQFSTRKLPEINIDGVSFIIDVAYAEIREKQNLDNCILFRDLDEIDGKYILYLDQGTKVFDIDGDGKDSIKITIDQMVNLDPEGIAIKYGLSLDTLPKMDSELASDSQLLAKRIWQGELPKISICGRSYFIDVRLEELRAIDDFNSKIDLRTVDVSDTGKYVFFYDTENKEVKHIAENIIEIPKNLVVVELPHDLWLDPVASGRKYENNEFAFLKDYPLQHNLEARIRSVSETHLPELIKQNIQKKANNNDIKVDSEAKVKQRRGKGLRN